MLEDLNSSTRDRVLGIVRALMKQRSLSPSIQVDQSLRDAGLKSLDLVNMMMAIEDEFGIEIPQHQLTMDNFRSIGSIERLLSEVAG